MNACPRHPEDLALARDAWSGIATARAILSERLKCVPRILAARNARLGSPLKREDLEDLIQDVLAAIWKKIRTYEGQARLERWAFQFCILEFKTALRMKGRRPMLLEDRRDGYSEPLDPGQGSEHAHDEVHCGLARLSQLDADTLRLKHFSGLTFIEISRQFGESINTIKTRYYRALTRLHAILEPGREGER